MLNVVPEGTAHKASAASLRRHVESAGSICGSRLQPRQIPSLSSGALTPEDLDTFFSAADKRLGCCHAAV